MCGIAGIVSLNGKPVSVDELHVMCAAMLHRGPDDEGFYLGTGAGLGMRRLSIIDLETGRQPIRNEDGSIWVVLNGEIYNFRQLRDELKSKGHRFYTGTDTETIVHLYEEYGTQCIDRLRGMFGFALWDERRRRLLLARDRLGIKPLYYAEVDGRLVFASELKSILQLPDVPRHIDWSATNHLFTFLFTPRTASIIRDVKKLEPGHFLLAKHEQAPVIQKYWDLRFEPDYSRPESYFTERLAEVLDESVQLHLVSDVPVGAFLSGGLDSSSVVAAASKLTNGPLRTFSIGFSEADYDELAYARAIAKQFGTQHSELVIQPDVLNFIDDLPWYLDEPFGDSSAIPTFMVSKLASEEVKVVLSGDGGDELFAGYDKYLVENRERRFDSVPIPVRGLLGVIGALLPEETRGRNFLRHFALRGSARYLDASTLFRRDEKEKLFSPDVLNLLTRYDPLQDGIEELSRETGDWLSSIQAQDIRNYLPLDILTKVDRMSMASSIEARVPLLDHKFVEFTATIPPDLKLHNGQTKYVLKQAMKGVLPEEILHRPKRGFAVPLGHWFRGQLETFVHDLLLSDTTKRRGVFNTAYIERLLQRHKSGRELDLQLWTMISFELWCRTFLDGHSRKISAGGAKKGSPFLVKGGGFDHLSGAA